MTIRTIYHLGLRKGFAERPQLFFEMPRLPKRALPESASAHLLCRPFVEMLGAVICAITGASQGNWVNQMSVAISADSIVAKRNF